MGIVATAIIIVVVAIPEGLPLAVSLTLAYSLKRMTADQAMASGSPCETLYPHHLQQVLTHQLLHMFLNWSAKQLI
jgi:magnesium-transporting ATPase (P-type)